MPLPRTLDKHQSAKSSDNTHRMLLSRLSSAASAPSHGVHMNDDRVTTRAKNARRDKKSNLLIARSQKFSFKRDTPRRRGLIKSCRKLITDHRRVNSPSRVSPRGDNVICLLNIGRDDYPRYVWDTRNFPARPRRIT